jgi:hypothetical protein
MTADFSLDPTLTERRYSIVRAIEVNRPYLHFDSRRRLCKTPNPEKGARRGERLYNRSG